MIDSDCVVVAVYKLRFVTVGISGQVILDTKTKLTDRSDADDIVSHHTLEFGPTIEEAVRRCSSD